MGSPDKRGHAGEVPTGRFAPSPTGPLHLGNLRTALAAWLFARRDQGRFLVRMEDLDRHQSSRSHEAQQLRDLKALGLDHDGEVIRQSDRFDLYEDAIAELSAAGLTYPCYCTRAEIRRAAAAPHGNPLPDGAYPGTCSQLSRAERAARERSGRPPALRLRAQVPEMTVTDLLLGQVRSALDDVVLRRNDGVPAYNLAVVLDDAAQGVTQVVRGDDLATSAPRQRHIADLLGLPPVTYAHVPLVLGPDGQRLAKRDGAVTLADQAALGNDAATVCSNLARSLGQPAPGPCTPGDVLARFDASRIPPEPWVFTGNTQADSP